MKKVFSALFVLLLIMGGVLLFALPQKDFSESENRVLQKLEAPTAETLLNGKWQERFADFTADQFPARDFFVQSAASVQYYSGRRDLNGGWIGKDGRLFEKVTENDMSDALAEKNEGFLLDFAAEYALPTTVLAVPSAAEIYGNALPPLAVPYNAAAAREKLIAALPTMRCLDLTARFTAVAGEKNLYYRTDHHWTAAAAEIAVDAYLDAVGAENTVAPQKETVSAAFYGTLWSKVLLPGIEPDKVEAPVLSADALKITADGKEISLYDESYRTKKDVYCYFFGGNHGVMTIETGKEGKTLLLLKDSFANSFLPELLGREGQPYGKIIVIDLRYYSGSLKTLAEEEHPDEMLVLYELHNLLSDPTFVKICF